MKMKEIVTIFTVTDYRTGNEWTEAMNGDGQKAIKAVRSMYPRHTKFVLDGFEIDGLYVPFYIRNRYNDRD